MNQFYNFQRKYAELNKNMLISFELMKILLPNVHIVIEVWILLIGYLRREVKI